MRAYLAAWEDDPTTSEPLMAMLRGAIVNDQALTQLRDFIQSRLAVGARGGTDAALRAGLVSAMLVGLVTSRRIIGVPSTWKQTPLSSSPSWRRRSSKS